MTTLLSSSEPLRVGELFSHKRLFVLGGTGFLGKIFWSMLLDRFPDIDRLYLLVRATKGLSSEERFWQEIAPSETLTPLRNRFPGEAFEPWLRAKVVPVDGDVALPRCGVSAELLATLQGNIDAVVNVAGVVDFSPPLDKALHVNALGAQHLVDLARALGGVPVMHTSTCYVAGRRKGVALEVNPLEQPFPHCEELGRDAWNLEAEVAACHQIVTEAEAMEDSSRARSYLTQAGTARAQHWGWPNIYTYTKSLGEQLVASSGLPFALVRPACCESAEAFPCQGWNEGMSTSAPVIYLMMRGQLQVPLADVPLDLIPSDQVCVGMILSLAELLEGKAKPVYQYGASDLNPCTAARFGELIGLYKRQEARKLPACTPFAWVQAQIEPFAVSLERFNRWGPPRFARVGYTVAHTLRSLPAQAGLWRLSAAQKIETWARQEEKIAAILHLFAPFTTTWNGPFDCRNTRAAWARLSEEDKLRLPWHPEQIDYPTWMHQVHLPGLERWVFPTMDKRMRKRKPAKVASAPSPSSPSASSQKGSSARGQSSRIVSLCAGQGRALPILHPLGTAFVSRCQDLFYGTLMHSSVTGRAFLPWNRNVLVVANHVSHLDMGLVHHALGRYGEDLVSFAAQDYFFNTPCKQWFFSNVTNLLPIDRKQGLRKALHQAEALLGAGKNLLLFPEGTRSRTGDIAEFKPLVGHLALSYGIDVLPLFLDGTHAVMPKGAMLPRGRELSARIGPPLCVADLRRLTHGMLPAEAAREVTRLVREAVLALREGSPIDLTQWSFPRGGMPSEKGQGA